MARFQVVLLIVGYKYTKSCEEDQMLQILILRTKSSCTDDITQPSWLCHFHPTTMVGWKYFVPVRYQRASVGLALEYLCMIHRVGRCM